MVYFGSVTRAHSGSERKRDAPFCCDESLWTCVDGEIGCTKAFMMSKNASSRQAAMFTARTSNTPRYDTHNDCTTASKHSFAYLFWA